MFSTDDNAVLKWCLNRPEQSKNTTALKEFLDNLDKPICLQTTAPIVHLEGGEIGHKNNTCSRRRIS